MVPVVRSGVVVDLLTCEHHVPSESERATDGYDPALLPVLLARTALDWRNRHASVRVS